MRMRTEDGSIIQECLNGEPEAFGVLVDKYKEGIYAFVCNKLLDFQDAQDVTQEVFLQAYRDLHSLKRQESFAFWLYRIAYRRCMQFFRVRSRRVDRIFIADQDPEVVYASSLASSLDSYRESQLDESVREALDSLPDLYSEVLVLHYFGGMTIKDMARAIGASPGAIAMRLSRARAQLKPEIVPMMDTMFGGQRLPAGFTFYIVEAVKRKADMPTARWYLSASAVNGKIYAIGGENSVEILSTVEEYDPATGVWIRKADMPTARCRFSTSVVNGKIYAIGGAVPGGVVPTVEKYDPVADKWTRKSDMPTARGWFSTGVVDEKVYAIGGVPNWGVPPPVPAVEEYDPATDKWTKKADMPKARGWFSASAVGGKIYIIGGGSPAETVPDMEEYDPAKDEWTEKASMITPRWGLATCVVDEKIYAIGGVSGAAWNARSTVEEYDPATDKWTKKADMPTARGWLSTNVVDEKIYAIGGTDSLVANKGGVTPLSAMEEYDTRFIEKIPERNES